EVILAKTLPSNTLCNELRQLVAASRQQSSETVQLLLNGELLVCDTLTIEGAAFEHGQCPDGALEFTAVLEPKGRFALERCDRAPGLYISEVNNHRVTHWDCERAGGAGIVGRIVVGGFGRGSGPGQLAGPRGLCFDENSGVFYVAEAGNRRVTRWCPRKEGAAGGGQAVIGDDRARGEVEEPGGICLGNGGKIYIADVRGHAVGCWSQEFQEACIVAGGRGPGDGLDQLDRPVDVAVDSKGFLYVAEFGNDRVTRWKDKTCEVIAGGRGSGDALEQLASPTAICLQESRDGVSVLVAEAGNHRVSRWTPGMTRCEIVVGGVGSLPELETPSGLCYDAADGSIYVAEAGSNRVTRWMPGALLDEQLAGRLSPADKDEAMISIN
ncbi:trim71, partial [Symbiodinium necroappetens]